MKPPYYAYERLSLGRYLSGPSWICGKGGYDRPSGGWLVKLERTTDASTTDA